MGILVEYNPDLALRDRAYFEDGSRSEDECLPHLLEVGKTYPFKKIGQRLYWLHGELPLLKTDGKTLSLPIASIVIHEVRHARVGDEIHTTGVYEVKEVFTDTNAHFNGFAKVDMQ